MPNNAMITMAADPNIAVIAVKPAAKD